MITEKAPGELRALVISTYPTRTAVHGGQLRSQALRGAYDLAFTHVRTVGIYDFDLYSLSEIGEFDISLPPDVVSQIRTYPFLEQFMVANAIERNEEVREGLISRIRDLKPDVMIYEHPYLFRSVSSVLSEIGLEPTIIYSSHNDESELLQSIISSVDLDAEGNSFAMSCIEALKTIEEEIATAASGVISVSNYEGTKLKQLGAKNVLVVPNSMNPSRLPSKITPSQFSLFENQLNAPYALFVGSDHLPNVSGFLEMVGHRLGFLPPETKIVIAGGAGNAILRQIERLNDKYSGFLLGRLVILGRVSDELLALLLNQATCLILPMVGGSGSNLKTAEAILSGKPIIATGFALRGFDSYMNLERIQICDDPGDFKSAIADTLLTAKEMPVAEFAESYDEVTWAEALAPLPAWLTDTFSKAAHQTSTNQ